MSDIIRVIVPVPLAGPLDYRLPTEGGLAAPGFRVLVKLGRRDMIGVIAAVADTSAIDPSRLRRAERVLDTTPLLPTSIMTLMAWCARYYHRAIGDVYVAAVPAPLRSIKTPAASRRHRAWRVLDPSRDSHALANAPSQRALLEWLSNSPQPVAHATVSRTFADAARLLRALRDHQWIEETTLARGFETGHALASTPLNDAQQRGADQLDAAADGFAPALIEGVTGSGKTELYFQQIERVLDSGGQVLCLVPEIGLTPQFIERVRHRFTARIGVFHSRRTAADRADVWWAAADGVSDIVIGTRSSVFIPMPRLGLIVVDEEHDESYKQQDGLCYNARDVALKRAQRAAIRIVLGSATPALESLRNAQRGRFMHVRLDERAAGGAVPALQIIDIRSRPLDGGMSRPLLGHIERHINAGNQVLVFVNRRGFAPVLACHDCGWTAPCRHCDAHMTLHAGGRRMRCHHCGASALAPATCPDCSSDKLVALGAGTERVAEALARRFPDTAIARFDRDSTAAAGTLDRQLRDVASGRTQILVGTQMLAKGHDFASLSCVAIVGADGGLFSADFRATETLAQMITQVAGRAGRTNDRGEVWLQTRHPDHPLLSELRRGGYTGVARQLLDERRAADLPPFGHLAILRADARQAQAPLRFLERAATLLNDTVEVSCLGPIPAPMQRRAGLYRAQLLLQAQHRRQLHPALDQWQRTLDQLPGAGSVSWSLDVDPYSLM